MTPLVHSCGRRIELLAETVEAARRTEFWRPKIGNATIDSLSDFKRLPIVEADEYRRQRFSDLVANPNDIEWIPGPWLGQSPSRAPVAEGANEARIRVRVMRNALSRVIPKDARDAAAVVVCSFDNRYFGAEMCAVFARMGTPAHLVSERGASDLVKLVNDFQPDIVALLSDKLGVDELPRSVRHVATVGANRLGLTFSLDSESGAVRHVATVGANRSPRDIQFVDLYVYNEFGVLGSRRGEGEYELAHDAFYFENSSRDTLIVTPYFSRTQPIIRLDTGDRIRATAAPNLC